MASLVYGELEILRTGTYSTLLGTDVGEPQPITASVSSLFLDGAVVSGESSGNREILLSVFIEADTRAGVVAAEEALAIEADRQTNVLVYTPDDGPSIVYETFRAVRQRTDDKSEPRVYRTITLTIPALPFARSNTRRDPFVTLTNVVIMPTTANLTGAIALDWVTTAPIAPEAYTEGIPFQTATGAGTGYPTAVFGGLSVVSGCTLTTAGSYKRITMTGSAAELVSSSTVAVTAALLTVGVAWDNWAGTGNPTVTVGIEWFNGASSIKVDWGTPKTETVEGRSPWATFKRPAAATAAKYRMKIAASSGDVIQAEYVLTEHLATASYNPVHPPTGPFTGGSFYAVPTFSASGAGAYKGGSFEYFTLPSTVDASAQPALGLWLYRTPSAYAPQTLADGRLTMRLHSGATWSAWYYQPDATENIAFAEGTWRHPSFDPTTPDQISAGGAADLTVIDAVSFDLVSVGPDTAPYQIGPVTAGPLPGEGSSDRGNLFVLDTILGSARSPAAVHLSSTVAMTDAIAQAVDPADGPPLLVVTSDVATAAAPQQYQGVYSILGTRVPASAPTTPTLTIVQKHGGVTVATSAALPGETLPGDHYVDFGNVSLPLVAIPDENVSVSLEFTVAPSSSSWAEVLVLNTNSPLMMLEDISPAVNNVWQDEPSIDTGIGKVWLGDDPDRLDAYSPLTPPTLCLPFTVKAPSVELFAYSTAAAPNAGVEYYDRWLVEPA